MDIVLYLLFWISHLTELTRAQSECIIDPIMIKENNIVGSIYVEDYFRIEFDINILSTTCQATAICSIFQIDNGNNYRLPALFYDNNKWLARINTNSVGGFGIQYNFNTLQPIIGLHHFIMELKIDSVKFIIDDITYEYNNNFDRSIYHGVLYDIYMTETGHNANYRIPLNANITNLCWKSGDPCTPDPCANGVCTDTGGLYQCNCDDGYTFGSGTCVDDDECVNDPCGAGDCVNIPGSYECNCNSGYKFESGTCVDVNECDIQPDICGPGNCVNIVGSYECNCNNGYLFDATLKLCVEKSECCQEISDLEDEVLRVESECCHENIDSTDIGCSLTEWTKSSDGTITEESGRIKLKSEVQAVEDIYVEKVFRNYVNAVISYNITSLRLESQQNDYAYIKYKCDDDINFIEEKLVEGIFQETTINNVLDLSGAVCDVLTIRFGIYVSGGWDDIGYLNCPLTISYSEHDAAAGLTRLEHRMNYLEQQLNNIQSTTSTAKTAYNLYDNTNNNNDDIYKYAYTSTDLILVTLINISISLLIALCVCKLSQSSGKNNQYRSVSTLSAIDTE